MDQSLFRQANCPSERKNIPHVLKSTFVHYLPQKSKLLTPTLSQHSHNLQSCFLKTVLSPHLGPGLPSGLFHSCFLPGISQKCFLSTMRATYSSLPDFITIIGLISGENICHTTRHAILYIL